MVNSAAAGMSKLPIVRTLLESANPSIEYKTRIYLLGESTDSPNIQDLRERIRSSSDARRMLSHLGEDGRIATNPYRKWQGPLWTLVSLAHLDYPQGDESLLPIRDQAYDWLLSEKHLKFPRSLLIPGQEDKFRRCAVQEASVIWSTLKLGIADERTDILVQRLKEWQWPDGGWNCDKRPEAKISSLYETFIPIRALNDYGRSFNDKDALDAARRASEVLLKRHLYRRFSDGTMINPDFTLLTFPYFYHYNVLPALVIMAEGGYIQDELCDDALDLLESKRLPDGGFPLERRIFKTTDEITTRGTFADWGPVGKRRTNEFVTCEALYALKVAGRLS